MSNKDDVLYHLQHIGPLTWLLAFNLYKLKNLPGRIYDLKAEGYDIVKEMVETDSGKWVAEYFFNKET